MNKPLDTIGPLTAVLVDPDNLGHVKELTLQRTRCGRNAKQIPQWLSEIRDGTRRHYLYYLTTSLPLPPSDHPPPPPEPGTAIGSGAMSTLHHHGPKIIGLLPPHKLHLSGLMVDPASRGQDLGNLIMEHRLRVAFADPAVQAVGLDTLKRFERLREWHRRLGFVETGERAVLYEGLVGEDLPVHVRGLSEEERTLVFCELGRREWVERYGGGNGEARGERERERLDKEKVKGGIPDQLHNEPK